MRKILNRESYLRELNTNLYYKKTGIVPINEEAPFASDIPWGDSLVGRLINSLARKTKIVFNKVRISGLVRGLKSIFDEILEIGKYEIDGDRTQFLVFLKLSDMLKKLSDQVNDEEDVSILIDTTNDLIDLVNRYESEDQDVMIGALEEFLEYLKGLKSSAKETESDELVDVDSETKSDDPNLIFYKNSRVFLQSIVDLSKMIKQNVVRIGGGSEEFQNKLVSAKSKLRVGSEYMYLNSKGEKIRCMLLSLNNEIQRAADKKWLTSDDIKGRNLEPDQACVVYKRDKEGKEVQDYNLVFNSQIVEVLKLYSLDGKEPGKIEKPVENTSTFFDKEKYTSLEKTYQTTKKVDVLINLIKMSQKAVKIYTSKKDQDSIKFYTDKLNQQISLLVKLQAKSWGINLELTKDVKVGDKIVKKSTGKFKDINTLKSEISKTSGEAWTIDLKLGKNPVKLDPKLASSVITPVKSSFDYDSNFDILLEEVEANLGKQELQARNAWKKVVKAYNDSKIDSYVKEIEELLSVTSKDGKENLKKAKKDLTDICKQVILNKSTVGTPISFDTLIKEEVNINDMSKSISLFTRVLIAFKEDTSLIGSYGSAIKPLRSIIDTYGNLSTNIDKLTKESILKFNNFKSVNEKNEFSGEIKEKFDEIFIEDVKKLFTVSNREEIESRVKETAEGQLVVGTSDPIIEIVRLFNRAWRIHTPGVIPSGRTEGKVSNSVFREYECLSDNPGTPDRPGPGPYRNIELYEQWFEAVQDILSDTKYRPIFSENTVFLFSNEETGKSGDEIKKPGKILLQFINRLLSDTKMYNKGAMNKFIEEYFNLNSEGVEKKGLALPNHKDDLETNAETTKAIEIKEVKFAKIDSVNVLNKYSGNFAGIFYDTSKGPDDEIIREKFKNISAKVKAKVGDKEKIYYMTYKGIYLGYPLVFMSTGNFVFDLTQVAGEVKKTESPKEIFLGSFPKTDGKIKVGASTKLRYVSLDEPTRENINEALNDSRIDFEILSLEILVNKKDNTPYLGFENKYYPGKAKTDIDANYVKSNVAKNLVTEK